MDELTGQDEISLVKPLTGREQDVLGLMADGLSNREIAEHLTLALSTVKWYVRQVHNKLGVENRWQAVQRARKVGLMPDKDPRSELLHGVPAATTPFVGRVDELEQITRMLAGQDCRLLTLVGPGGSGKTRLAMQAILQLAHSAPSCFPDGIYYIPLVSVIDTDSLLLALLRALGLTSDDDITSDQQLLQHLRSKKVLLVLDNYEQLLNTVGASLPVEILHQAVGVKVLMTSRARLNVKGEQLFFVSGLPWSSNHDDNGIERFVEDVATYSAVQLFVDTARRTKPQFVLTDNNVDSVVELCALVEGMPLGLVLAAGWMGVLSPQEILVEVQQQLDFLDAEWQDLAARHRSLRAVFETSWRLLDEEERTVLRRLSIFRTKFRREAAETVAGATPKMMLALANKSWIQQDQVGVFQMHEILRHYAHELLRADKDVWQDTRNAHASYFTAYAHRQHELMWGPGQQQALADVSLELDNITAAWQHWLTLGQFGILISDLLPCLHATTAVNNRPIGLRSLIDQALRFDTGSDIRQAIWLTARNTRRLETIRTRVLRSDVQQAWAFVDGLQEGPLIGIWSSYLAFVYASMVDREAGEERLQMLIKHFRKQDDRRTLALTLKLFGLQLESVGELAEAERRLAQAYTLYAEAEVPLECIRTLFALAIVAGRNYRDAVVFNLLNSLLKMAIEERDKLYIALARGQIGRQYLALGDLEAARPHLREAQAFAMAAGQLEVWYWMIQAECHGEMRYGNLQRARAMREGESITRNIRSSPAPLSKQTPLAWQTWELGDVYRMMGELGAATECFEIALPIFRESESIMGIAYCYRGFGDVARARGEWQKAKEAYEESLRLLRSVDHIWTISYVLSGMGKLALHMDDPNQARSHLMEALYLANKWGQRDLALMALAGFGWLLAKTGEAGRAVRILAFVAQNPASWKSTRVEARKYMAAMGMTPDELNDVSQEALDVKLKSLIASFVDE